MHRIVSLQFGPFVVSEKIIQFVQNFNKTLSVGASSIKIYIRKIKIIYSRSVDIGEYAQGCSVLNDHLGG